MLILKDIIKVYETTIVKETALKGVSMTLNKGEFVSIVGPSGCGKTTLLNIIGGLDRYTSGDLIINGKSTKEFKDVDWDAYRNSSIGFIFQSYNLINHLTVLDNVALAMTLSGKSTKERHDKAVEVLTKVGLEEHMKKRPDQLSGGQKQRVAIARALTNDPEIILADEPTGALDSKNSEQIIELIKEVAQDKLIILVTHNKEIADKHSTRIITLSDGLITSDNRLMETKENLVEVYHAKKTSMSFLTALKLSFNNLKTKIIRSLVTAFAGSIGIIGIALVLAIANGFNTEVEKVQKEALGGIPLMIRETTPKTNFIPEEAEVGEEGLITPYNPMGIYTRKNIITKEYVDYVKAMNPDFYDGEIVFDYGNRYHLFKKDELNNITEVSSSALGISTLYGIEEDILMQYDVLSGNLPKKQVGYYDVSLIIDQYNRVSVSLITALGLDPLATTYTYNDFLNKEIVVGKNDNLYEEITGKYYEVGDKTNVYAEGFVLRITSVLRIKDADLNAFSSSRIALPKDFEIDYLDNASSSIVGLAQKNAEALGGDIVSVLGDEADYKAAKKILGINDIPSIIYIYISNFEDKEAVKDYLDKYNERFISEETDVNMIYYYDIADSVAGVIGTTVSAISYVLIAFAGISLVVSSIMIGIITYVSVLERTKEIGILRSLGARKKDIARVFNAETFIIGLVAGAIGISVTYILSLIVNIVMVNLVEIENIANLPFWQAVVMITISVILTVISGLIPSSIASRKDPVEALRVE